MYTNPVDAYTDDNYSSSSYIRFEDRAVV